MYRWYQRGKDINTLVDNLCIAAEDIRRALLAGDISEVGRLLELFWTQKKRMAAPPSSHTYFTSRSSKQKLYTYLLLLYL
jgi:galactokinase/mevalonate kinase-like predicted kinase